jgi:excisionase family DNA binding protein
VADSNQKMAFSVEEAARCADSCRDKIYNAINAGKLRARKDGRRTVILSADLEAYLNNLPVLEPKHVEA